MQVESLANYIAKLMLTTKRLSSEDGGIQTGSALCCSLHHGPDSFSS
jgi:hypothetical protein